MASTGLKVLFLLTILVICNAREQPIHVKPDNCPQEYCSCSSQFPDCQTLSEYALNTSSNLHSKFILTPGEYYLDSDFSINDTSIESFSLIGMGSENTTIYCRQNATLSFNGLTNVTVQNVAFVSCGEGDLPGISLTNINTVKMVNISVANTTSGALYIKDSSNVELTNLAIINNRNSLATIVSVQNSKTTTLNDLNMFNNSIGEYDSECVYSSFPNADEVVFRIDGGFLRAESVLHVTDNIGPFGVMALSNVEAVLSGDWSFKRNRACLGGSLALDKTSVVQCSGNLYFIENKGISKNHKSTAGLLLSNSATLNLTGNIESSGNEGYILSIQSISSQIFILGGMLNLTNNLGGYQGISLTKDSKLIINDGALVIHNNIFRRRIILVDNSELSVSGFVSVLDNPAQIVVYDGNVTLRGDIKFQKNAGVLYASRSMINISGNSNFTNNSIEDDFKDGTLALIQSKLFLGGTYTFLDNIYDDEDGGGIYAVILSTVTFSGTGCFNHNLARYGGAVFIDQSSRIEFKKGSSLHFINNTALKGGAIFIGTSLQHTNCSDNPDECLIHFEDENNPQVSLVFQNNKAYPGGSVIHVNFDHIENLEIAYPAVDDLNRTITSLTNNSVPMFTSDSYRFCFCEDDSSKMCSDRSQNVTAFKGKSFHVKVRALKFYGSNMSEPVRSTLESSQKQVDMGDPSINASLIGNDGRLLSVSAMECTTIKFTVKSSADKEIIIMNVGESFFDMEKSLKVHVNLNPFCPDGFPFNENRDACVCDENILNFLLSCNVNEHNFEKRKEYPAFWMGPSNDSTYQGAVNWYNNCPHRFCITSGTFTFLDDGICANNRYGVLCGSCNRTTSLLLGGEICKDCSDNAYLALLVAFLVAGILVVALIFLSQITVAAGTINGLIFYVNILNSNQTVFFPVGFFRGYTIFISWLNLDFGIETCFYDGMNQIGYSGLQFVFPVYIWILAGLIVVLCRYSVRVSKIFSTSDPVAVLATIILLSFNSLAQNIISIFYSSTLHNPGNNRTRVWRYDGNVDYASGHHLTLIIVASVFLLLLLTPYTLVLFSAQVLQKSDFISKILRRLRLQPFIHAYLIPFKPNHRYWAGLCLMMRAVLLTIFALGESLQINLLAIITACIVAITMFKVTGGIYDKSWIDTLEMSFLVNLGVLAAATSYSLNSSVNGHREIATYISITIAILTFIGIIIVHVYWRLKKIPILKEALTNKIRGIKRQKLIKNEPAELEAKKVTQSVAEMTPAKYQVELREPLLESQLH